MYAFQAYVITYFEQVKNYVGQVKIMKFLPGMKLVLEIMLVPGSLESVGLFLNSLWTDVLKSSCG